MKRIVLLLLVVAVGASTVWALFHFGGLSWQLPQQPAQLSHLNSTSNSPSWAEAVEKVKADRGAAAGGSVEIPPELRHYSDRHWFLATQVAEVQKHNIPTCQDFLELAAMIERGEMVSLPAVTKTYVLYGVGEKADDSEFSRYHDDHNIEIYNEAQLGDAYKRLEDKRSELQSKIAALSKQSSALRKRERQRRVELQKQIGTLQQELNSSDEDKALFNLFYGEPDKRQRMFRDYESLQQLAKNFVGRSFEINNSGDRRALKVSMLSSLRPEALKILEEIATVYHHQFDRPLPVSSLMRPEQYQRVLSRFNRNAVLIDSPPHSTGLAFDIDYRYMSGTEQTFLMAELARLKRAGRIEVIRESRANYHVFTFVNGTRPSDELITASLEQATLEGKEAHHATEQAAKPTKVKARSVLRKKSRKVRPYLQNPER
jgi:Family of unknown function (DUF5715)